MSEVTQAPGNILKSRTKLIITIISVVILLIIYGAGIMVLPISILTMYQNKNCDSALSLNKIYTSVYPAFVRDETVSVTVKECEAYALAASNEAMGLWQAAYDAYQAYSIAYPNGLYVKEAYEHGASALLALAKDQAIQKQYEQATKNLQLIITENKDTSVSIEALELLPTTYASWGVALRTAGEFERAEQVFNDFRAWTQSNQKAELEVDAWNELAQTYIAWGLALQSQKQYESALAKFDLAISIDPDALLTSGSTVQAKADQVKVYIDWGNDLVERKDFTMAVAKLEQAVALAGDEQGADARDALTKSHIQWASDLSAKEDFQGALEQLKVAKNSAVTDSMKQAMETTLGEVYMAFSNSSEVQARRAMREAFKSICEKHKKPDLPIFGLNKDLIHAGIYGIDEKLSEDLEAKTPGELHYVACIEVGNRTVESRYYSFRKNVNNGYYLISARQMRIKIVWNISLRDITTGEEYRTFTIEGDAPPPFPTTWSEYGNGSYYGGQPDINILIKWLSSVIK